MIDPELKQELDALNKRIDEVYQSAERTRKYIWWTIMVSAALIVIPLLILPFAAGSLLSSYSSMMSF
ncbi:MAG TPA: hypothetical protein VF803_00705 [Candidatus Paceibacterota bacterium]